MRFSLLKPHNATELYKPKTDIISNEAMVVKINAIHKVAECIFYIAEM